MSTEETLRQCAIEAFSGVDGILVINMDSSRDRYETFCETVGKYLPQGKLHRISAVAGRQLSSYGKPPWFTENTADRAPFWGGTGGCALSHRNAIAFAKSQGWRNVLIFEDDVFIKATPDSFKLLSESLLSLEGAYLLYLGYNRPAPYGVKRKICGGSSLWESEGVIAAHAYVVSAELYDVILKSLPESDDDIWQWLSEYRAIDVFYRDFVSYLPGVKIYVMQPIICYQKDGESDIGLNAAQGTSEACTQAPIPFCSVGGLLHALKYPFHRLKIFLNSHRTRLRARKGGLPGYKKRKK